MRLTFICAAVVLAALIALVPAAGARSQAPGKSCGRVAFTPNSDDLATNIRAIGLTCGLARDFVRDSRGRPGARFRGFSCRRTDVSVPDGLPYKRYRCTGAGDVIRWRRY